MVATGKSLQSAFRAVARAESYVQSLVPWPLSALDPQDLVDVRLAPGETREFYLNFDPTAVFMQVAFRFQVKNEYAGPALTGDLSFTNSGLIGTNVFTGQFTAFRSELSVGDVLWFVNSDAALPYPTLQYVTVKAILSDTEFVGNVPCPATTSFTSAFGKMLGRNIPTDWATGQQEDWTAGTVQNTGTVSIANNTSIMTGIGTLFTQELVPGDKILLYDNQGSPVYYIVNTIVNNTQLTIRGVNDQPINNAAYTRFYTRYSDIDYQIYDASGKSFGSVLNVQAQQGAFASMDLLEAVDGILHRPYWLGRRVAIILRMRNLTNDARRVHGHVYTVRVLT